MDTNAATGGQCQNSQLYNPTSPCTFHFKLLLSNVSLLLPQVSSPLSPPQQLFQHPGLQLPTLLPTDATLTPAWCKVLGPTAGTVGVWDERRLRAPSSRNVMPVVEPAEVSEAVGINS